MDKFTKIETIRPPSHLDLIKGALYLFLQEKLLNGNRELLLPNFVDGYELLYTVKKSNNASRLAIGVYTKGGRKFFVKFWNGRIKDLTYYFLVHEYLVTRLLSKRFNSKDSNVRTSEIIGAYENSRWLLVIFDFIEGVTLEKLSLVEKAKYWNNARIALQKVSKLLSQEEGKIIGSRGLLFYSMVLSILLPVILILSKGSRRTIFKAWLQNLKRIGSLSRTDLVLAHRDLMPNNIILGEDSRVYIVDWDNARITLPDYDFANLRVFINQKELLDLLSYKFNERAVSFLKSYIATYQTLGSGEFGNFNKEYLRALKY